MKRTKEEKAAKRFYKQWSSKASKRQAVASCVEVVKPTEVFKRLNTYITKKFVVLAAIGGIHLYDRETSEMYFWAKIVK